MAKITSIDYECIKFDDGSKITFDHYPDCCECNYADFEQLDDVGRNADFDTKNMMFEAVPNSGFRFGDIRKMFFIPCYSEQNGYYSSDIDIYYNDKLVLNFECEEHFN